MARSQRQFTDEEPSQSDSVTMHDCRIDHAGQMFPAFLEQEDSHVEEPFI